MQGGDTLNFTKKKILEVALNLFAKNGYSSVSIRDICKQVQIKESSIYYHFKNKQAIFDELIFQFESIATSMMTMLETSITTQGQFGEKSYSTVCDYFFEKYLMDGFCNKVMRLMMIEQFNNGEVRNMYNKWMFVEPLTFQSNIFQMLMEMGIIEKQDSEYLAIRYYTPIFFFAQKWLFCGELSEQSKNAFRRDAYKHIQSFFQNLEVYNV